MYIRQLKHISKTGLFSATVAAFIIESYQSLSPNPVDTTNALLVQITQQLVNMSTGTPLTIVTTQSNQPYSICRQGQRAVVLQLDPQLVLRSFRDIDAAMGSTV